MTGVDRGEVSERSAPSDADSAARQSLTGLLRPYGWSFTVVVALQVIGAVAGQAPLLAVVELGRVLLSAGPVDHGQVWLVVRAGAAGLFVRLVFTAASSGLGHVLDDRVQLSFRRQLAARLGQVPIGWFSRRRTGELAKVVGEDVSAVHPFIAHAPGELVAAFVVPVVSLVYLLAIDWRLTLITLIPVVLAVTLVSLMMTPARLREQEEFDAGMGRIANSVVELVQGISVVKAFGGGGRAHREFRTAADDFVGTFNRWARGMSGPAAGMQLVLSPPFVLLVVLIGGALLITGDGLARADLLPFLLLGLGLTAPVAALGHGFDDLQAARRDAAFDLFSCCSFGCRGRTGRRVQNVVTAAAVGVAVLTLPAGRSASASAASAIPMAEARKRGGQQVRSHSGRKWSPVRRVRSLFRRRY